LKTFSIEQAERLLPSVDKLVRKAQRLRDKVEWILESHEPVVEVNNETGFHLFVTEQVKVNREFHQLYYKLYGVLEKLAELGVIVTDIDEGLIDFPFKMNGREVLLCWQQGEDKLRFWREFDSALDERKPIVDMDELFAEDKRL